MINHEITLVAFHRCPDGNYSITDIVETNRKNASYFLRYWRREPEIDAFSALSPNWRDELASVRKIDIAPLRRANMRIVHEACRENVG